MRQRPELKRVRVEDNNSTVQSKLDDSSRQALHEMVQAKKVEIHFEGRNPETKKQTRFIGIEAHPKLFSKLFWKVQVRYGNGRHDRLMIHGTDEEIEHQLWRLMEMVEEDFQSLQRAEALKGERTR